MELNMQVNLKFVCFLFCIFLLLPIVKAIEPVEPAPVEKKRPTVGLVLSGGGAKGFAYIGLLKVFHEVGLPIDYISGTSIGSIMGGLYALGYSPEEIENIIASQNWNDLLVDKIPRKYIAYEEKEFMENSIVSLPIHKLKIGIGESMYEGQQINLMLNKFFSPAWNINDFSKLHTPYLCVATNLITGDAEVLTTGYLPMAVRSSMSIPGYFTPTKYQGKYLVDGGIVDNYPAEPLKEVYSAQILIGGSVMSGLKDSIGQLNSIASVISQIIFFRSEKANKIADSLIDINVDYDVAAGMMDFTKYDSIIAYGERVAREHYDEIKALADSLNAIEPREMKQYDTKPLETYEIADIKYEGNKDMSTIFLNNYFGKFRNATVNLDELEEVINSVYGTRFFKHIFYELEPVGDDKANLIIHIKEASPGYLSASLHYDNDYDGSVRLNGIFRNFLGDRSKLFTELILGPNPRLHALYLVSNGSKPGLGIEADMYDFKINDYDKDVKTNAYKLSNYSASVFVTSILKNLYSFRGGIEYEYFRFKQTINIDPSLDSIGNYNSYGTVFMNFRADTRNKANFSTHGYKTEFEAAYVMLLSKGWTTELFTNSLIFYLKYDQSIPIYRDILALKPGIFIGGTLQSNSPPVNRMFGAGGLNEINYIRTLVPFTGVHFIQKFGDYSAIGRMKLQYNIYQKLYLTARADIGSVVDEFDEVFESSNIMFGYGLTFSYNSIIGPIELTAMSSNMTAELALFLNVGYSF